ncbi:hypothetical protein J6590_034818 [Homalodisca vitripennis]|nr:hypothetical protein J6590_034818 [Homalodisca vitripennis]
MSLTVPPHPLYYQIKALGSHYLEWPVDCVGTHDMYYCPSIDCSCLLFHAEARWSADQRTETELCYPMEIEPEVERQAVVLLISGCKVTGFDFFCSLAHSVYSCRVASVYHSYTHRSNSLGSVRRIALLTVQSQYNSLIGRASQPSNPLEQYRVGKGKRSSNGINFRNPSHKVKEAAKEMDGLCVCSQSDVGIAALDQGSEESTLCGGLDRRLRQTSLKHRNNICALFVETDTRGDPTENRQRMTTEHTRGTRSSATAVVLSRLFGPASRGPATAIASSDSGNSFASRYARPVHRDSLLLEPNYWPAYVPPGFPQY